MKFRTTPYRSSALLAALCCGPGLTAHAETVIFTENFETPVLDSSNSTSATPGRFSTGLAP